MTAKTKSELLREANRWANLPEDYSSPSDDCHIAMHALSKTLTTWNPVKPMPEPAEPEVDAFDYDAYDPPIEPWLRPILNRVYECCICPVMGRMTGFDLEWYNDGNMAEETDGKFPVAMIAPSLGEITGGPSDGEEIYDLIDIDLAALIRIFDTTDPQFEFAYVPMGRETVPGTDAAPAHIVIYTSKMGVKIFFAPLPDARKAWVFDTNVGGWRLRQGDEIEG